MVKKEALSDRGQLRSIESVNYYVRVDPVHLHHMKQNYKGSNTREAILDAAERLLATSGYKRMTIDSLAREVGIGKGSVYLHFASKEEIALSHIDRIIDRLKDKLYAIAQSAPSPSTRMREMLCFRVMHRFDSIQTYSGTLNELLAGVRHKLLVRRRLYFEEEARLIATVIEDGQFSGEFAAGDAQDLSRTLVMASNSLLPFSLSPDELGERKSVEKAIGKIADLMIRGLKG